MGEHGITQFKLEQDNEKIELKKGGDIDMEAVHRMLASASASQVSHAPQMAAAPVAAAPAVTGGGDAGGGLAAGVVEIPSPMVGTFYSASDPESDPFVAVGTKVEPDSTVCIIEAMKVMNQINADVKGEIVEILVENGTAVQYGEPLFRVKTA